MSIETIADSLLLAKQELKEFLKKDKSLIELRSVYLKLTEISDKVEQFRDYETKESETPLSEPEEAPTQDEE